MDNFIDNKDQLQTPLVRPIPHVQVWPLSYGAGAEQQTVGGISGLCHETMQGCTESFENVLLRVESHSLPPGESRLDNVQKDLGRLACFGRDVA